MTIRVKLFLTFLLTTLVVVMGMHLFTRWSLEKGFTEFVEKREKERVNTLVEELEEHYAETQGWEKLAASKQNWILLLWRADSHRHRPPRHIIRQAQLEPENLWPPALSEKIKQRRIIPFELRVMLLNTEKSIIFGRNELLSQLTLHPIQHNQQTVGYLGLMPGSAVNQPSDIFFMERQAKLLIGIAVGMVLLSALIAWFLAYQLGRPLKRIISAAKELAIGNYKTRLPVESTDEMGQLARNFNDMAAALEQAEQSRRRWVADISHELRTPLAVLRGELEALMDGIRPLTPQAIESLSADVMRLNRLTDDLYQLALSDQGALSYRKKLLDPVLLLQDDMTAFTPDFTHKEISIRFANHLNKPVKINADPDRLAQLFRNLLTNSLNYTDHGGQIHIMVKRLEENLIIELADSSPGVAEQDLKHLFDRFYRVDSSRNRHLGGAGLGLAICSNIVHAHEGSLIAAPSALGGLAIQIILPVAS
ncbi:MAG: ATP-binding protein [Methylicorpusculum sp.]|uniref:ATP-binding protein n=1 Tax=Methylicorpusculum sp. TaxID=2713644 RepID=UPI002719A3E0|nr:ATP-binding protein [Methylicorpusculum sp.]MDO8845311.1 ATP-binding protein [Methylicorpusculum sp.]MDO8940948.1 ATP-binding protein [Methylicorpusculum sp.]MDP2200841.1 ATP-binding protein [Methylicorpusculum sp.]